MYNRFKDAIWALLKAIDILFCTIWLAPLYVFNLADKPSGRQMISSYIGQASINGHRWAAIAEKIIDWMAVKVGDQSYHCFRSYIKYKDMDN